MIEMAIVRNPILRRSVRAMIPPNRAYLFWMQSASLILETQLRRRENALTTRSSLNGTPPTERIMHISAARRDIRNLPLTMTMFYATSRMANSYQPIGLMLYFHSNAFNGT